MLIKWAIKWGVRPEAVADLRALMGTGAAFNVTAAQAGASEAAIASRIRQAAPAYGLKLWRNNVGVLPDKRGVPVRFGLGNDSAALNAIFKSSDLIGIDNSPIMPHMVGLPRGQFVALETKAGAWTYKGDTHERAQLAFINVVTAYGGRAQFINHEGQL
jgi:hypothetical protein